MRKLSNISGIRWVGKTAAAMGAAALFAGASHAQNSFTDAGTSVENTFTLDYEVSGTSQPTITNSDTPGPGEIQQGTPTAFTVDRLVDHLVTPTNSPTPVAPGTTNAGLTFEVTNEGNDNQRYSFLVEVDNTDDFGAGPYTIEYYVDGDNDGDLFNEPPIRTLADVATTTGTAAIGVTTDDVAPDETIGIRVVSDIDAGASDGELDNITLVAQARDPQDWQTEGPSGSAGAITAEDTDGNLDTGVAENVWADGAGPAAAEDAVNPDGLHSAQGTYVVASPDLSAVKSVDIIATTPTDCATQAAGGATEYAVPGACVEYVITVTNNGATATAEAIDIADILPAEVTFVSATFAGWDTTPAPTLTAPAANTDCDGGAATCNVSLTGASLAPTPGVGTLTIRALID